MCKMVNLDDDKAKILRVDPIQFKIFCAEKCLESLPTFIYLDTQPQEKIISEMIMECFLFFAVSAIDIVLQKINKEINLEIIPNKVNPNIIIQELKKKQTHQAASILVQMQKYFEPPIHTEKIISKQEFDEGFIRYGDDAMGFCTEYENRNTVHYQHVWNRVVVNCGSSEINEI